jgi:hypothetical protein
MSELTESFKHSLISSKLWLCQELEKVIAGNQIKNPIVHILGSWHNILGFMLLVRNPSLYGAIHGYDIDKESIELSDKVLDNWKYAYPKVYNHNLDVDEVNFSSVGNESIFINCSVDQMKDTTWYDNIPENKLVCLQSTDLPLTTDNWDVKQSYPTKVDFTETYRVRELIYCDSILFDYGHLKFYRHMMIGIK